MSKGTTIFAFVLGAAVGSVVTWKIVKTKYEQIIQEEIDSMKEYYSNRYKKLSEQEATDEVEDQVEGQTSINDEYEEYTSTLTDQGYTNYSNINESKGGLKPMKDRPYVISPDEFGEKDDYETTSLFYYADRVLAYTTGEPIHDVDAIVGRESLDSFGEYEPDSVYVRNDKLKTDYEILLDEDNYADRGRGSYNPQVND